MQPGFIFGGDTDWTYEQLQNKRRMADALARENTQTPRNVGEGLHAIGRALSVNGIGKKADKQEARLRGEFDDQWAQIFGGGSQSKAAQAVNASYEAPASASAGTDWLKYNNSGAVRNQPISQNLQSALSFLPEMGISMEVFSGGQPGKGTSDARVGSTRHDHGNAADVFFYKDGRKLDWANPRDLPIFEEIVRRGREAGISGFGAGEGYMQPGSMHIGFGNEAVWGADGHGVNAPEWLRRAYNGTSASPSPQAGGSVNPDFAQLAQLASNPMASPAQKQILSLLMQQQMQANDPSRQLDLQLKQAQLDGLRSPSKRDIRKDANGRDRYVDSGELVFPDVEISEDPEWRMLQTDELTEAGLDGPHQVSPDGKIDQIGGSRTNVTVEGSKLETEYDKTRGKAFGTLANTLQDSGRTARRTLTALDAMERAAKDGGFYSGLASGGVQFAKRAATAMGFDATGVESMEAFNALAKQAALDVMGGSLGTGFSNADRDFVLDQVPGLQNTPQGNALLIEVQRSMAERQQQIAKMARDYERENGRIDIGFEDQLATFSEQNPVFTDKWWSETQARIGLAPANPEAANDQGASPANDLTADERTYLGLE